MTHAATVPSGTAATRPSSATPATRATTRRAESYRQAPSLKDAAEQHQYIRRGHRGESVQRLQEMLAARGYDVGTPDGRLGSKTEAAIRQFQADQRIGVDGIVGPETLGALGMPTSSSGVDRGSARRDSQTTVGTDPTTRAPAVGEAPPPGAQRAGDLAHADQARRARQTSSTTPLTSGPGDARLAEIQQRAVHSAARELDAGVREDRSLGRNRGARVDEYARTAGMSRGGEWCGYFTGFNYTQAARESGVEFSGQHRLHSYQKARSYFLYRNYTDASRATVDRNEALRQTHAEQGSERRFMTFDGSTGDRYADARRLPHETYTRHQDLPIRPGDTALFSHGHVGMVESYDPASGRLTTLEGNVGDRVQRRTYDLSDPAVRARFDGFGRPAAGDFTPRD